MGEHQCPVYTKKSSKNITKIKELITNNPNIKPSEVQSSVILSAFREQLDWETIDKEVASVSNRKQISNLKQKMKNETEPYGHNFEAVKRFKEHCDKKDPHYIYKMNDKRANPDMPSFVFKSSTEKAMLALAMNREKEAQQLDSESSATFKLLCDELMEAATVAGYESAKADLGNFIEADSSRDFLKTWVEWWHDRRGYIFRAFAPRDAPAMNQAEVIHAGWAKKDNPKLSLLDASHADVRDSLLLEKEIKAFQSGSNTLVEDLPLLTILINTIAAKTRRPNDLAKKCFHRTHTPMVC